MSGGTPYKGLMPYSEEDAEFFFGREAEREIIIDNLLASRLTLLYGTSGVGKSSVLHAGVAYHLKQLAQQNLSEYGMPELAVVVFSSWRDDPRSWLINRIQYAVTQTLNRPLPEPVSLSLPLDQILQELTEHLDGDLLIIFDQFEEYFLYQPQEDGEGTFAADFSRAVNRPDLRANFLISIREDALAKLDRFKGRIPNLFDNYLRIEHLDREAAKAAIKKPIDRYNQLRAAGEKQIIIEPELVEAILDQVKTGHFVLGNTGRGVAQAGDRQAVAEERVETPFLQLVMTRLWEEEMRAKSSVLRLETLDRLHGAENIVRTHLDEAMNNLSANEQTIASLVFHHLVTPSGMKIAHTVSDLAQLAQTDVEPVLERLSGPELRILRPVAPPPDRPTASRYEIFHDVLAPAILNWRTQFEQRRDRDQAVKQAAIEAAEREKEAARQRELKAAEQRAEEQQRRADEQARIARRLSRLTAALVVIFLVALAASVFAFKQYRQARKQARIARAQQLAIQSNQLVSDQPDRLYTSVLLAVEGLRNSRLLQTDSAIRNSLSLLPLCVKQIEHKDPIRVVYFSPDGKYLATVIEDKGGAGEDKKDIAVRIWDVAGGREVSRIPHDENVSVISFSPDGKYLATVGKDNIAWVWDVKTRKEVSRIPHGENVSVVCFSPDGRYLATVSKDNIARIWDVKTRKEVSRVSHGGDVYIYAVSFSPDGKYLATASKDDTARVWIVKDSLELSRMLHKGDVYAVSFSPDGKYLATASEDNTTRVWRVDEGQEVFRMPHEGKSNATRSEKMDEGHIVSLSPDGKYLAAASAGNTVQVWRLTKEGQIWKLTEGEEALYAVSFSSDGKYLVAASGDNTARVWDVETWKQVSPSFHSEAMYAVCFSPDGKYLATAGENNTARVWDVETWKEVSSVSGMHGVSFSPDGRYLATASEDNTARVWKVGNWQEISRIPHDEAVYGVSFSPDGKYLATASEDNTARVWDVKNWEEVSSMSHDGDVYAVSFSPDNRYLATASEDNTARVWEVGNWKEASCMYHEETVQAVCFSPDGKYLATASEDNTARVWDVETWQEVSRIQHDEAVYTVCFSPDSKYLATMSMNGVARVWLRQPEELIEEACRRIKHLTEEEWELYLPREEWKLYFPEKEWNPYSPCEDCATSAVSIP